MAVRDRWLNFLFPVPPFQIHFETISAQYQTLLIFLSKEGMAVGNRHAFLN
jgi:hypothetical protein